MKINVSFLVISKKDKKTPMLACIKEEGKELFIPSFVFSESDYPDIFEFARNKFKEISGLNAIDITGKGWVYLHSTGSIVKDNELHIVYGSMIPETLNIKNCEWISIFEIMQKDFISHEVFSQLIYCFNSISR